MSEHAQKGHPIAGLIMVLIISGLVTYGIGLMNDGDVASAAMAGVLLLALGAFAVLSLARE